jgi:hypothetical protein
MVDFPLPFVPTMTTSCPGLMVNETSRKALPSDSLLGYENETFLIQLVRIGARTEAGRNIVLHGQ